MPLPTGLRRDSSGIFHLRIGIPEDVRPYWPRRSDGSMAVDAYRRSLRTPDRSVAITLAHGYIAEYQRKFAAIREQHRPSFTRLTPKLVEHVTEAFQHRMLHNDDVLRSLQPSFAHAFGFPEDYREELTDAGTQQDRAQAIKLAIARGDHELTVKLMNHQLDRMGLPPANWHLHPMYLAKAGRVVAATFQALADRASGELVDTPPAPKPFEAEQTGSAATTPPAASVSPRPSDAGNAASKTLRDAVPHWKLLTDAKPNAIQRMDRALLLWEEAVGELTLSQITRETGADFVAYLLDEDRGFGRKTAKNHADCISALMNVAARKGLIPSNPLDLKFSVNDQEERTPWTQAELALLHGQAISGPQPAGVDPEDADLLINLLLWSGARVNEIAALRVEDIQEREGILAAYIRRETTKEDASVRWLPIASAIRGRVAAHAAKRRTDGSEALFPSFAKREKTSPGDLAGRWFREYRVKLGLPQGRLWGSHKWRHTVRTKLASEGLGEALLDAVTGHKAASGSAGRKSYTHTSQFPLKKVLEAIERLAWPWPARQDAPGQHRPASAAPEPLRPPLMER
ncbi:MAG: hypothetical protein E6R08_09615 [Nevskiaceae bacterium]|nr:MAG: hypothetical protein E6R08_09615 [Nevskiaceae bacterium]